jgi:hypothetical protein
VTIIVQDPALLLAAVPTTRGGRGGLQGKKGFGAAGASGGLGGRGGQGGSGTSKKDTTWESCARRGDNYHNETRVITEWLVHAGRHGRDGFSGPCGRDAGDGADGLSGLQNVEGRIRYFVEREDYAPGGYDTVFDLTTRDIIAVPDEDKIFSPGDEAWLDVGFFNEGGMPCPYGSLLHASSTTDAIAHPSISAVDGENNNNNNNNL